VRGCEQSAMQVYRQASQHSATNDVSPLARAVSIPVALFIPRQPDRKFAFCLSRRKSVGSHMRTRNWWNRRPSAAFYTRFTMARTISLDTAIHNCHR